MITVRRSLAAGFVVAAALGLAACTATAESEPADPLDTAVTSDATATGTEPIVFAFVCRVADSADTETYTTYSAVWDDARSECSARPITGTEMSSQQRDAVRATDGDATLGQLAAACAERGTRAWDGPIESAAQANVAAGLLQYCPGHPEIRHLREAVAAWRG